jgi:hypothetical protein
MSMLEKLRHVWLKIKAPQSTPPLPITYHQTNIKAMQTMPSCNYTLHTQGAAA